jgi:hypothetical protein
MMTEPWGNETWGNNNMENKRHEHRNNIQMRRGEMGQAEALTYIDYSLKYLTHSMVAYNQSTTP